MRSWLENIPARLIELHHYVKYRFDTQLQMAKFSKGHNSGNIIAVFRWGEGGGGGGGGNGYMTRPRAGQKFALTILSGSENDYKTK